MENDTFLHDGIERGVEDSRRAQDFDDLQNEIAGRETGRNQRFLGKGSAESQAAERRKHQDQAHLTALQMLLQNDPEYAALYQDTMDLLRHAESATEQALVEAELDLSKVQNVLGDTLDNANKLADGTAVFKDANGNVWTADGRLIEGGELDGIVWKDGVASYEDYLRQKQAVEDAQKRITDLRRYQTDVLGTARDRLTDSDNPVKPEDLREWETRIQEEAPEMVEQEVEAAHNATPDKAENSLDVASPKIL